MLVHSDDPPFWGTFIYFADGSSVWIYRDFAFFFSNIAFFFVLYICSAVMIMYACVARFVIVGLRDESLGLLPLGRINYPLGLLPSG